MNRELRFQIEGMYCGACVVALTQALMEVPGTDDVRVDLHSRTAIIVTVKDVSEETYCHAVQRAGYRAVSGGVAQSPFKKRYARWGVLICGAAIVAMLAVLLVMNE